MFLGGGLRGGCGVYRWIVRWLQFGSDHLLQSVREFGDRQQPLRILHRRALRFRSSMFQWRLQARRRPVLYDQLGVRVRYLQHVLLRRRWRRISGVWKFSGLLQCQLVTQLELHLRSLGWNVGLLRYRFDGEPRRDGLLHRHEQQLPYVGLELQRTTGEEASADRGRLLVRFDH